MKKIFLMLLAIFIASGVYASQPDSIGRTLLYPVTWPVTTSMSLSQYDLGEVVVTATRTPLPLKDSPVITRVITGKDIALRGIPTLQNLLERELAGVEFHQAGYGTTVSFQGLDARYVLFLVDGERMSGETYGNIDYERIPISNIEQVEIVRGASSVLYGSNAMGAIVNIITKMPKRRVEVNGSLRYGTRFQNNGKETLGESAPVSDIDKYRNKLDLPNIKTDLSAGFNLGKFRSLTSVSFRTVDAYKLTGRSDEARRYGTLTKMMPKIAMGPGGPSMVFDDSGMPVFISGGTVSDTTIRVSPDKRGLGVSGYKDWYVGQKFDYTINSKFRLELSGNYFKKYRYDFRNSIMDDNPTSGIFESSEPWQYESSEGYGAKLMMEHSPNRRNKVYLTFMRDEYFRYQEALHTRLVPKQRHTYNIPRLLWTSEIGRSHRLTTGMELINERLRFDLNPNGYNAIKSLTTGAVYVQDEIMSGRKLSFVAGLRADWSDSFGWRITPQLSAKYRFDNFALRGNYSNGYRSPSLKEMYMKLSLPMVGSPIINGNPSLKTESNHYLSLSLDYNRDWINLSATVNKIYFRNKIDAMWTNTQENGHRVMKYENISKSEHGSLELIARVRLTQGLFLGANYNYIFQSDNAPEESTQYIFPSPHTATFSADYSFVATRGIQITINANVRYIGAKDYEDFMSYIHIPQVLTDYLKMDEPRPPIMSIPGMLDAMKEFKYFTGSYKSHHNGYAICNASVDVNFRRHVSLTVGVNNIFDYRPKVVNFNSAMTPGANGFIKVAFNF